ncbi:MAG: TRAP transporter large permease subunit [Euzebyales bacterium]|nr:TRAP transporter large permease subunit [Euzebyales bacterium]
MTLELLAIAMFVLFLLLLLLGYPVAFSFAGTAVVFGLIGVALGVFDLGSMRLLFNRWFKSMTDPILLAIPFFVFMGAVFEKSGLAERLLSTVGLLMGPARGGLALTVVVVGSLLAAATGVVAATVIVMGLISLPTMLRYNYNHRVATGVIVASGTLAQLLPPSLVLIVLAGVAGVSVGDLFVGAIIPGIILAALYGLYIIYLAFRHPEKVPALPPEARVIRGWALFRETMVAVAPPLLLIFAVLGSIFFGIAFPTEAGAVGAVGACVLAAINRNLGWRLLKEAAQSTTNITALVLMILFASTFFALVFDQLGGQRLATEWLTGLPGGFWTFLIVANIAVFLLGVNLEFLEISFIALPIFLPAVRELGIDPVWFLVMMAINLNIAFISPPVGFSLFYLQSVAPKEVRTIDIHRGALPFMVLQGAALLIVLLFPLSVTWLVDLSQAKG